MRVNYAIVLVRDMKRSVSFYRDIIGLPLRFESPGWTEFATEGATLALHAGGHGEAPSGEPGSSPAGGSGQSGQAGQCRPGLSVPDLDAFHSRMIGKKVPCLQEPTTVFGARVAQYQDPDGLVISVGEDRV